MKNGSETIAVPQKGEQLEFHTWELSNMMVLLKPLPSEPVA